MDCMQMDIQCNTFEFIQHKVTAEAECFYYNQLVSILLRMAVVSLVYRRILFALIIFIFQNKFQTQFFFSFCILSYCHFPNYVNFNLQGQKQGTERSYSITINTWSTSVESTHICSPGNKPC